MISFVTVLAVVGYAIGILQNIQDLSVIPHLSTQYNQSNALIQETILTFGVASPLIFLISLGLPGIWFLVVSFQGLSNINIPKFLLFLGILWGIGNILTAIAHAIVFINLIYLTALGAFIFAPLWGILEGLFLLRLSQ